MITSVDSVCSDSKPHLVFDITNVVHERLECS